MVSALRRTLARGVRPARRLAAWFALVEEQRLFPCHPAPPETTAQEDRNDHPAADAFWLRAEAADARLATEVQRLVDEVGRVRAENAAILALISEPIPVAKTGNGIGEKGDRKSTARAVASATLGRQLDRGTRETVLQRFSKYKELIRDRRPVIDLWCGRGEFLELAEWVDIPAYGVDTDADTVESCKLLGLDTRLEDPVSHLSSLTAGSLGGVFCSQRIEYLTPEALRTLVREVARVLKPGGIVIFETLNPDCLAALANFWGDPARVRPIPATALAFLMRSNGLQVTDVLFPATEEPKLRPLQIDSDETGLLTVVGQINGLLVDLERSLYGAPYYTLAATRS